MPLHLGQRLHAFVNGIGQPKEHEQVKALYRDVEAQFGELELLYDDGRANLVRMLTKDVLESFELPTDHPQATHIAELIGNVLIYEKLFELPDISFERRYTTAQYWDYKSDLNKQLDLVKDIDETYNTLRLFFCHLLDPIFAACPSLLHSTEVEGIRVETDLLSMIGNLGVVIEKMAKTCNADEIKDKALLTHTSAKLEYNLILESGGNPADPRGFSKAPKYPSKSELSNPKDMIYNYLGGTPLPAFFAQKVNFTIPTKTRFEHHHMIAGSGHGKTQTLQYLILKDLKAVAKGKRSVVVIDSQGDLINTISNMNVFAKGGALHDRVVIVDPTDVEWPASLNLFDVGQDRLEQYSPLDRERLTNSILELYDFVLGSLLDASMTQKQNVIFRYVTRLMLHIPNATIHTLRELMEENSEVKFAEHFSKLSGSAKHFFDNEFSSKEFAATRRQVLRRLWGILENQTFERMFSHPRSKLDLFAEMNAGKIILINTAKDLLKESGTEIFGRFFIALIAQAAQERATLPKSKRMPTMVYIDEASDYFDKNIGIILSQARKYNIGMVLAHQYLGQLDPKLQEAFAANTSIKMAGGVSSKDARQLAPQMHADAQTIEGQKKGVFSSYLRGITPNAIPLSFPFGTMEDMPRMLPSDRQALQQVMRKRYAVHHSELNIGHGGSNAASDVPRAHQYAQNNESDNNQGVGKADARMSAKDGRSAETPQDQTKPTKGW